MPIGLSGNRVAAARAAQLDFRSYFFFSVRVFGPSGFAGAAGIAAAVATAATAACDAADESARTFSTIAKIAVMSCGSTFGYTGTYLDRKSTRLNSSH